LAHCYILKYCKMLVGIIILVVLSYFIGVFDWL